MGKYNKREEKALLNSFVEHAIQYKITVKITFQVSKSKISTLTTELRELFKMKGKWWILTQSGLAIELEKIKSVVQA
ncbi:MAG: hypothetical protein Sapg2KO_33840 [Saprospiraceae bacterium]